MHLGITHLRFPSLISVVLLLTFTGRRNGGVSFAESFVVAVPQRKTTEQRMQARGDKFGCQWLVSGPPRKCPFWGMLTAPAHRYRTATNAALAYAGGGNPGAFGTSYSARPTRCRAASVDVTGARKRLTDCDK